MEKTVRHKHDRFKDMPHERDVKAQAKAKRKAALEAGDFVTTGFVGIPYQGKTNGKSRIKKQNRLKTSWKARKKHRKQLA